MFKVSKTNKSIKLHPVYLELDLFIIVRLLQDWLHPEQVQRLQVRGPEDAGNHGGVVVVDVVEMDVLLLTLAVVVLVPLQQQPVLPVQSLPPLARGLLAALHLHAQLRLTPLPLLPLLTLLPVLGPDRLAALLLVRAKGSTASLTRGLAALGVLLLRLGFAELTA